MGGRVTLLTDFGTRDGFVGAVKGVLATFSPGVAIDDVSHDLPPGDCAAAARALSRYWLRYPEGTVHLVVVDPGVGTARRPLACSAAGRFLVGPDNGVLTPALATAGARAVRIEGAPTSRPVSHTFHARDVFAPAAAALANGHAMEQLGASVKDPVLLAPPVATREEGCMRGEVVGLDRFGNATTNVPGSWASSDSVVEVAGHRLRLLRTYGEVGSGAALALVDSEGWIEVAVRDGSAAERLGIGAGTPVLLTL